MKRTVELDGRTIEYDLERKRVKNLNLRIRPDQSVHVSANRLVPERAIRAFLQSKSGYILKALDRYAAMAKNAPAPKTYVDGETVTILGRELRLKVVQGKRNNVVLDGTTVLLTVKDELDRGLKQRTMDKWMKNRSLEYVRDVCNAVYPEFRKYGVDFPEIKVRKMVSRWGICRPKRKILTFNVSLLEAPPACVEYVVTHEFVHFLQPDHSREFYRLLGGFMPDWKERKAVLEKKLRSEREG